MMDNNEAPNRDLVARVRFVDRGIVAVILERRIYFVTYGKKIVL